ncbi:MAG: mechanosensitive ion channel [Ruminococcaceae bacterium]|nr:mechanosensitive ion channel [Oscillospiraceae bacterium]
MEEKLLNILQGIISAGIRIVIAALIGFVTFWLINFIGKKIATKMENKGVDKTLTRTLIYISKLVAKSIIVVCLIGFLGIDTSAIVALIASLGLCIGLAVNGALSNVAGGVLIIVTRPFKVDDFIEAQGESGTVVEIRMTNTKIVTPDNKVVYVPNGSLANGNIVNYSANDTRRVDFEFAIGYASDVEKAKEVLKNVLEANEKVLKEKDIFVRLGEHSESGLKIKARAWVNSEDYWGVYFDILEAVKAEFDKNGIKIPYKQLDVHIKNDK